MIHYPGKDVKEPREGIPKPREGIPKPREGIPKASIGIALVGSQQAAVPIMGFWP